MSHTTVTVFAVLHDEPRALSRMLIRCHGRGWDPVSLRAVSDGAGTAEGKKEALEAAGVKVGKTPSATAALAREIFESL